jgi:tripartite-type tricarboxylate transporter receptor subunit TctC
MTKTTRALLALGLTLAGVGAAQQAHAQAWPSRPIKMIVPYTPGGYTDYMARTVGQKLSEALGQTIVFENRPGANSVIGADAVAKPPLTATRSAPSSRRTPSTPRSTPSCLTTC